jgi:hypothetical protein
MAPGTGPLTLIGRVLSGTHPDPDANPHQPTQPTTNPTPTPHTGAWAVQQARNLTVVLANRAHPVKLLIRDRDARFTSSFNQVFQSEHIRIIRTAIRVQRIEPGPGCRNNARRSDGTH